MYAQWFISKSIIDLFESIKFLNSGKQSFRRLNNGDSIILLISAFAFIIDAIFNLFDSFLLKRLLNNRRLQSAEYLALQSLYNETNGDLWTISSPWSFNEPLNTAPHCNFEGVTCDGNYLVTGLDLQNFGLDGSIPDSVYQSLDYLQRINMRDNPLLTGTFPLRVISEQSLNSLSRIDFSKTGLTGTLDPLALINFSELANLSIDLEGTYLDGTIPTEIGVYSHSLNLLDTRISGTLPTQIGRMTTLRVGSSNLGGSIPVLQDNFLKILHVKASPISGSIPLS